MADLVQQHESDDEKVAIVACSTIMSVAVTANYISPKLGNGVIVVVGYGVRLGIYEIAAN